MVKVFYLLSLFTGILECGWIAYGIVNGLPMWQILCYPLAYHVGNLFPKPFSLGERVLNGMAIVAVLISVIMLFCNPPREIAFILACVTLFCNSVVIQSVRSEKKKGGNRLLKRMFRVIGFALAPLTVFLSSALFLLSSVVALIGLRKYECKPGIYKMTSQKGYSAVMFFHQLHYFFYAHITLATVSEILYGKIGLIGVLIGAVLFCGTWITYMSVEPILSGRSNRVAMIFIVGHIGIMGLLALMSLVEFSVLFGVLWMLTGFGGGVVYTVSVRAKSSGAYNKESMIIAENIGHTYGLVAAVVNAALYGNMASNRMLLFGSMSAMIAVILLVRMIMKEEKNENIKN